MKQLGATTTTGYNTMVTSVNNTYVTMLHAGTAVDLDTSSVAGARGSSHNQQPSSQ